MNNVTLEIRPQPLSYYTVLSWYVHCAAQISNYWILGMECRSKVTVHEIADLQLDNSHKIDLYLIGRLILFVDFVLRLVTRHTTSDYMTFT